MDKQEIINEIQNRIRVNGMFLKSETIRSVISYLEGKISAYNTILRVIRDD